MHSAHTHTHTLSLSLSLVCKFRISVALPPRSIAELKSDLIIQAIRQISFFEKHKITIPRKGSRIIVLVKEMNKVCSHF